MITAEKSRKEEPPVGRLSVPWKGYTYYRYSLKGEDLQLYNDLLEGILSFQERIIVPKEMSNRHIFEIYTMIQRDWPSLYHIVNSLHFPSSSTTKFARPKYVMDEAAYHRDYPRVTAFLERCSSHLSQYGEFDKIRILHDTIRRHVVYHDTSTPNEHNVLGCIVDRKAVCESIAKTFKLLCDVNRIPCVVVFGYLDLMSERNRAVGKKTPEEERRNNHAWNVVQLDGKWYNVDITNDLKPPYSTGKFPFYYDFFLRSDQILSRSYYYPSKFFPIPACPEDFELYRRTGHYAESLEDVRALTRKAIQGGYSEVVFELSADFPSSLQEIQKAIQLILLIEGKPSPRFRYRPHMRLFRAIFDSKP